MLLLRLRVGRRCGGGVDGGESFWSVEAANSYSGATRSLGACLVLVCVCVYLFGQDPEDRKRSFTTSLQGSGA